MQPEIVTLPLLCASFPQLDANVILRENILDALDALLAGDAHLVVVEGDDGIGKSTLLAQFCLRHPQNSISFFAPQTGRWSLASELLKLDLSNQLSWVLTNEEIRDPTDATEGAILNYLFNLQRKAQRERTAFYFVVDGLDQATGEDWPAIVPLLDLLPIGLPRMKILVSARTDDIVKFTKSKLRTFIVPGFTPEETTRYLSDFDLQPEDVDDLRRVCRGNPGHLSTVKRLLRTGLAFRDLLDQMPERLPSLFELEWERLASVSPDPTLFLALLAFDSKPRSQHEIACILSVDLATIAAWARSLGFLETNSKTNEIHYISPSFKKFAAQKLYQIEHSVHEMILVYLSQNPQSDDSLFETADHLQRLGRMADLLLHLTADNTDLMLQRANSLAPLRRNARLGMRAALELQRDGDLVRFALQNSVLHQMSGSHVSQGEVKAHLALSDYMETIELANSTLVREDRLHLLILAAKAIRSDGLVPEDALLEQISQTYNNINPEQLGSRAVTMAADMLPVLPELAIDLLERTSTVKPEYKNLDQIMAVLSIASITRTEGANPEDRERALEILKGRVGDAQSLYAALSLSTLNYSAREIIAEAERLEKSSDRLRLLSKWSRRSSRRQDAGEVVEHALKLALRDSTFAPTPRFLADLAEPLIYLEDLTGVQTLFGIIDAQRGNIQEVGPTEDLIALQLNMVETEARFAPDSAQRRLIDLYLDICSIEGLLLRTNCIARFLAALVRIDPNKKLEEKERLHSLCETELISGVEELLTSTAEQLDAFRSVIDTLSFSHFDIALGVARRINTELRRNKAVSYIIEALLDKGISRTVLGRVEQALQIMTQSADRRHVLLYVAEHLATSRFQLTDCEDVALRLARLAMDLAPPNDACIACAHVVTFLTDAESTPARDLRIEAQGLLEKNWNRIDAEWEKVESCFAIAQILASKNLKLARNYLKAAKDLRGRSSIPSTVAALNLSACIYLAIRTLMGLLPRRLDTKEDLGRLRALIERFPSLAVRTIIWSDLAAALFICERIEECRQIVRINMTPGLNKLREENPDLYATAMLRCAIGLYLSHKPTAFAQIDDLDRNSRDQCYFNIIDFLFRKLLPGDPLGKHPTQGYELSYEEISEVLDVLDRMAYDNYIYQVTKDICREIGTKRSRQRLTQQQVNEIVRRLLIIANSKLPDSRNIQHNGYRLACLAYIYKIRRASPEHWDELIAEMKAIPNSADCPFLLGLAAENVGVKHLARGIELLNKADEICQRLPSITDRVGTYRTLAVGAHAINSTTYRALMKKSLSSATTDTDDASRRRRVVDVIDFAYTLDPDLADALASYLDEDPARVEERKAAEIRVQANRLRNLLIGEQYSGVAEDQLESLPAVAWKLLGTLNAGRVRPLRIDRIRQLMTEASRLHLPLAAPVYAWLIQNAVVNVSRSKEAELILRPHLDSIMLTADLVSRFALRTAVPRQMSHKQSTLGEREGASIFIQSGDREAAIMFLREWVTTNVKEYLKICDPYFGPTNLEAIRLILDVLPRCRVEVLTSRKHHMDERVAQPWGETYRSEWCRLSSDDSDSEVEVIVAGVAGAGELPIHDRWWLTNGCGIRLGTSFGSLGIGRDSEISFLSGSEARVLETSIDEYLLARKREHHGKRIQYEIFPLLA